VDESLRPIIENDANTDLVIDLGIEFSMPFFMAGFAVNNLLNDRKEVLNLSTARQFTGYMRGNIPLSQKFDLAPAIVYNNYSANAPDFFEFNTTLFYDRMFWFGLGTRFDTNVNFTMLNAMIGVEWNLFRIGYSYDYSVGDLGNFRRSSHEIMLSMRIPHSRPKPAQQRFVRFME